MSGAIARNSVLLAVAQAGSRLLGWVRLAALAAVLGTSGGLDPYLAAFRLPDLLYQLIAAGALSSALVPILADLAQRGERERARRLVASLGALIAGLMLCLGLAGLVAADSVARLVAPGLGAAQLSETALLTRILLLSPLLLGLAALMNAVVASEERFRGPAVGPLLYNLAVIVAVLAGGGALGGVAPALGTVVGAALLLGAAIPEARRVGYRLARPDFGDPLLGQALRAMGPRVIGLGSLQVVFAILTSLASGLGPGAITLWSYAFALLQFPAAVIGGAIGTALLPVVSRLQSARDRDGLARAAHAAAGSASWLLAPAVTLGALFADAITRLILGQSAEASAVAQTATLLRWLLAGLLPMGLIAILVRLSFSVGDTRGPVAATLASSALTILLATLLSPALGLAALAIGMAIGDWAELALLAVIVRGRVVGPTLRGLLGGAPPSIALALVAALAGGLLDALLRSLLPLRAEHVALVAAGLALALYVGVSARLDLAAARPVVGRVSARLGRGAR
ncbi:MAG: hypothetical protein RLZZ432_478 [Chloroflexota bacterium]